MIVRNLCAWLAVGVAFPIAARAQTDTSAAPSAHVVRLDSYLMPRDSEIAFARTAAPPALSRDAKVLVLTARGYETAVPGSNGFVCLVARSWDFAAIRPDSVFWDPRVRAAMCYNAQGAEAVLPEYLMKTQWAVAGASEAEIGVRVRAAWSGGALKEDVAPGAMGYMMSPLSWGVGASPGPWRPHLMFYYPNAQAPDWGANLDGTPVASGRTRGNSSATVYFVVVPVWSDGSPAPSLASAPAPARTRSSTAGHDH